MVKVGDRIRLSSMKAPDREGVVTALTGSLVRVRWASDQETTVVPAPGTLTVLAAGTAGPRTVTKKKAAAKKPAAKKPASAGAAKSKQAAAKTKQAAAKTKQAAGPSATSKKQARTTRAATRRTP